MTMLVFAPTQNFSFHFVELNIHISSWKSSLKTITAMGPLSVVAGICNMAVNP